MAKKPKAKRTEKNEPGSEINILARVAAETGLDEAGIKKALFYGVGTTACIDGLVRKWLGLTGAEGPFRGERPLLIIERAPSEAAYAAQRHLPSPSETKIFHLLREGGFNLQDINIVSGCFFSVDGRPVNTADVKMCTPLLRDAIREANPKYILVLGGFAFDSFAKVANITGSSLFSTYRGSSFEWEGRSVGVTIHPEALTYNESQLAALTSDTAKFCAQWNGNSTGAPPQVNMRMIRNSAELMAVSEEIRKVADANGTVVVAVDTEWGNLPDQPTELRTVQIAWSETDVAVVILNAEGMTPVFSPTVGSAAPILNTIFSDPRVIITGHNFRSDAVKLEKFGVKVRDSFYASGVDTMLLHHMNFENSEQKLEIVGSTYLGFPRYDLELMRYRKEDKGAEAAVKKCGYGLIPDSILLPYAAYDAILTYRLYHKLIKESDPALGSAYFNLVHQVGRALDEMESNGVLIDQTTYRELSDLLSQKREQLREALVKITNWHEFNPNSSGHLIEVLYGMASKKGYPDKTFVSPVDTLRLGLNPISDTSKTPWEEIVSQGLTRVATPSTRREDLDALQCAHPFMEALRKYRFVAQMTSTFISGIDPNTGEYEKGIGAAIESDGRVHTRFSQLQETGRYSTRPNLQNIPKQREKDIRDLFILPDGTVDDRYKPARSIFVASPGYVLVEADWNQAELWTMGALSGDKKFMEQLSNSDVHSELAIKLFGDRTVDGRQIASMTAAEFNSRRKEIAELDQYRTVGKTVNFGVAYGMAPTGLYNRLRALGVPMSIEECTTLIAAYRSANPIIFDFLEAAASRVRNGGVLITPFGRMRHFYPSADKGAISGMEREAKNFYIQGTVAGAMDQALVNFANLDAELRKMYDFRLLLSIHDAVLFEVNVATVHKFIRDILPVCMEHGVVVPGIGPIYKLGKPEIMFRWGEKLTPEQCANFGLDLDAE